MNKYKRFTAASNEVFDSDCYYEGDADLPSHDDNKHGFWYWSYDRKDDILYQIHSSQIDIGDSKINPSVARFLGVKDEIL